MELEEHLLHITHNAAGAKQPRRLSSSRWLYELLLEGAMFFTRMTSSIMTAVSFLSFHRKQTRHILEAFLDLGNWHATTFSQEDIITNATKTRLGHSGNVFAKPNCLPLTLSLAPALPHEVFPFFVFSA